MRTIIVEDERYARENLIALLEEIEPGIQIVASFDSVEDTVSWLHTNSSDLIFLDIHLSDDLSFSIFDQVDVRTPIIFTTAYDQYAIQAFKVNSIDYLLKPIDKEELRTALSKFHRLKAPSHGGIQELRKALSGDEFSDYQSRFLVKRGDKMASIKVDQIAYFEGEDRYVSLITKGGKKYFVDYKLAELEHLLDPVKFFRLNRSYIAEFDAIANIYVVSKSRVKVILNPESSREIVVSTDNTRIFKEWLNR